MKRRFYFAIATLFIATLACAQEVSLGDAARAARANKTQASPNAKVYDNDNLPTAGALSTTTGDFAGVAASKDDKDSDKAAKGKSKDKGAASAEEDKSAQEKDFKDKAADLKKNIEQLNRELDVMQREQRLKAAAYYGDAGTKLRNQQQYQDDEKKYQSDLQSKQDQLGQAKQALDDLREQIRKAGLPASIAD